MLKRGRTLVAGALIVAGCGTNATGPAAQPVLIAFFSNRSGDFEIYFMNSGTGEVTNLTNHSGADFSPAWSPDGGKIAFGSWRDYPPEIYVMNADGTGQTRLTNNFAV